MAHLTREAMEQAIRKKVERPLFATLGGDHLRGWASDRSPYEAYGAMLVPLREVLGLRPARETKDRSIVHEGVEVHLTFHDLRRYLDDVARVANTKALEELYSPYVVFGGPELQHLRRLARSFITRTAYHDFLARAGHHRQRLAEGETLRAFDLLEASRIYLEGSHLLLTGEIDANLTRLVDRYEAYWLRPFVARRQVQGDAALLTGEEARILRYDVEGLEARLHAAHESSSMSEGGGSITTLDEFLVDLRMRDLRDQSGPARPGATA